MDPTVSLIDVEDIAHALSNLCRFAGHTVDFYSVGQHSVLVSELMAKQGLTLRQQLQGLLHDATEAYIVDIPRPLKVQDFMAGYRNVEDRLEGAIAERFGLDCLVTPEVKLADMIVLSAEARDLMGNPQDWEMFSGPEIKKHQSQHAPIRGVPPRVAKMEFLHRFHRLVEELTPVRPFPPGDTL